MPDENGKFTAHERAELIVKMTKEAERVSRRTGAAACVVICMFNEGSNVTVQDAGKFPLPPQNFYNLMQQAHQNGQMATDKAKKKVILNS
jgi:hypothetical protein